MCKAQNHFLGGMMARPSGYKAEYNGQVYRLCLLGATDKDIAEFIGIAESTLNNWKIKHPKFMESLKAGRIVADTNVAESLYNRAIKGDVTACIFWLKNRRPDLWRDRPSTDNNKADAAESLREIADKLAE